MSIFVPFLLIPDLTYITHLSFLVYYKQKLFILPALVLVSRTLNFYNKYLVTKLTKLLLKDTIVL